MHLSRSREDALNSSRRGGSSKVLLHHLGEAGPLCLSLLPPLQHLTGQVTKWWVDRGEIGSWEGGSVHGHSELACKTGLAGGEAGTLSSSSGTSGSARYFSSSSSAEGGGVSGTWSFFIWPPRRPPSDTLRCLVRGSEVVAAEVVSAAVVAQKLPRTTHESSRLGDTRRPTGRRGTG